jgi:hypothetical protein
MSTSRQRRLNGEIEENDNFLAELNEPVQIENEVEETIPQKPNGVYFESEEDFNSIFERMEKAEPNEVTGDILTHKNMEEGVAYNFVWTGYGTINDRVTGEPRKSVKLVNKDKETFYCASLVVMSAFEKIEERFPVPVRLVSLGMKEGKSNKYWNVKVYQL